MNGGLGGNHEKPQWLQWCLTLEVVHIPHIKLYNIHRDTYLCASITKIKIWQSMHF